MRWAVPLLVILVLAAPALAEQQRKQKCPAGTEAFGAPPPNGKQIWCRQPVPGGFVRQGTYSAFHRNGQKRTDGNYDHNKRHGKWTSFDREGNKVKEEYFYDDKKYKEVRFDKNGKPFDYDPKKLRAQRKKAKQDLNDWSGKGQRQQEQQPVTGFR